MICATTRRYLLVATQYMSTTTWIVNPIVGLSDWNAVSYQRARPTRACSGRRFASSKIVPFSAPVSVTMCLPSIGGGAPKAQAVGPPLYQPCLYHYCFFALILLGCIQLDVAHDEPCLSHRYRRTSVCTSFCLATVSISLCSGR